MSFILRSWDCKFKGIGGDIIYPHSLPLISSIFSLLAGSKQRLEVEKGNKMQKISC